VAGQLAESEVEYVYALKLLVQIPRSGIEFDFRDETVLHDVVNRFFAFIELDFHSFSGNSWQLEQRTAKDCVKMSSSDHDLTQQGLKSEIARSISPTKVVLESLEIASVRNLQEREERKEL